METSGPQVDLEVYHAFREPGKAFHSTELRVLGGPFWCSRDGEACSKPLALPQQAARTEALLCHLELIISGKVSSVLAMTGLDTHL